ncbi:MAG TPA: LamG-like jellyroll fold domain-containing protein [Nannocystaceae bacterium]|nr:LamG-like jellyroll fold domain-containing protein [Nannocystaceae bacterium]
MVFDGVARVGIPALLVAVGCNAGQTTANGPGGDDRGTTTGGASESSASSSSQNDVGNADTGTSGSGGHGGSATEGSSSNDDGPVRDCGDPVNGDAVDRRALIAIDCGFAAGCQASAAEMESAKLAGPMTLVAEVRLDPRPTEYAALVSRWDTNGARAWELGIDPSQQPYVWLSPNGSYAPSAETYARPQQQLVLGETWEVAAVIVPGERIHMFIDGVLVREQTGITDTINIGLAELGIGRRPGESDGPLSAAIGRVRIFDEALGDEEVAALAVAHDRCGDLPGLAPIAPITSGPKFHWFGYYDKFQFDPSDRYVLSMAVDFEDRAVTSADVVEIGMIDLDNGNQWTTLGESRAWNWQQGCMLQWVPGSNTEVVWNDREGEGNGDFYVARVLDVETQELRTLSRPIFTIAPDGQTAFGIDFERYAHMTAGYGYPGIPDANQSVFAPDDAGIWAIDMNDGTNELILSYADVAALPSEWAGAPNAKHFFYQLRVNPSGTRLVFYDRMIVPNGGGSHTTVLTVDLDGSDLFLVDDAGSPSHIDWRDDETLVVYSYDYNGYALLQDGMGWIGNVLDYPVNGHELFLPGDEWMVSDTYPDVFRYQHPFLYHVPGDEVFSLAHLHSPESYDGSDRCDNHPRLSRDGRRVVVDSAQQDGRQMYVIELGEILDSR